MQIERIFFPVKTLGPGNRIGIWTVGCPHRCYNCSNPELWPSELSKDIPLERIFKTIEMIEAKDHRIDGITITGGEPLIQASELNHLISYLKTNISADILLYTGFLIEELNEKESSDIFNIMQNISVLIDGRYFERSNDNLPLRGSSNQRIHILDGKYKSRYETLKKGKRTVQNVFYGNTHIAIGIPLANYQKRLSKHLKMKGVVYAPDRTEMAPRIKPFSIV